MRGVANDMRLERFEGLLEAYGSDFRRWPEVHAIAARALLAHSDEAKARLAEARALDRLLDLEPSLDNGSLAALTDRIVATAAAERVHGRDVKVQPAVKPFGETGRVIRLPDRRQGAPRAVPVPLARPASRVSELPSWQALAALAASLFLGIAIGLTDVAQTTTVGFAPYVTSAGSEAESLISAVQLDNLNVLDEDQI